MQARDRWIGWLVGVLLGGLGLCMPLNAQSPQEPQQFIQDYSKSPGWFPAVLRPYQEQAISPMTLENSPRLRNLIRDGRLELSLADALALALENNMDIAVQRYVRPMAQADVLRAHSGQAARGFQGAFVPGGLQVGAIGAGVTEASGGGGLGSAGGIKIGRASCRERV